ncbi:unnamed protein product [Arabidopsis thaliana]|uniref:Uncharacterized protein n=1 Tax=Arabidopsis thaliana TaxID=3702 RepID=A0A654G5Y7_ARATH|nr:unnamed protein product [Arabidopsis thaliana]
MGLDGSEQNCVKGQWRFPATFIQPWPLFPSSPKSKEEDHSLPSGSCPHNSESILITLPKFSRSRPLPKGSTHQQLSINASIFGLRSLVMLAARFVKDP